jgi:hypothetical protein
VSNGRDRTAAILGVAAGSDADEMRVPRIKSCEPPGEPTAERVVPGSQLRLDREPVRREDVSQPP